MYTQPKILFAEIKTNRDAHIIHTVKEVSGIYHLKHNFTIYKNIEQIIFLKFRFVEGLKMLHNT